MNTSIQNNFMHLQFASRSENESFARVAVGAFIAQLDPNMNELTDIKTVVSEAVTNSIIHGYESRTNGVISIRAEIEQETVKITIEDSGIGIEDLDSARQPLYTSKPELERSGMGFTIIENFMDDVVIESKVGIGTKITMTKRIASNHALYN
jgi:stage II sporulation protein AB (anti-sigma F factor)